MQRILSFQQFLFEATSQDIQNLVAKLQGEADSEKMRIGGTADKIDWAMNYVVLTAFISQLQDDLAKGKIEAPNYAEDLYNTIDGKSTDLKNKAIELMKMNGLSDQAAEELQVTPPDPADPDNDSRTPNVTEPKADNNLKYDDSRDAYVDQTTGQAQPNGPKNPVQEAKNWSLVKLVPNTLKSEKKPKRHVKPKSPAEKAFRTAFNHARNEARKILQPKPETEPQPNPAQNAPVQNQEVPEQV
jgi:hypothetical protein